MDLLTNSFFRFYKIFFYHSIIDMELKYIDKSLIDNRHLSKREFTAKGIKYDEVFEDLSNEKIFAIMSVVNSMLLLNESQCLEFERSLEIEEKN